MLSFRSKPIVTHALLLALFLCFTVAVSADIGHKEKHKFDMDSGGSRPRGYHISSKDVGYSDGQEIRMNIVKAGVFGHRYIDVFRNGTLGLQDGKRVLTYYRSTGDIIIGDAENLADIRLLPGVRMSAYKVTKFFIPAYMNFKYEFADEGSLPRFTGVEFKTEHVMAMLLDWARTGNGEKDNIKVCLSIFKRYWSRYIDLIQAVPVQGDASIDAVVAIVRGVYVEPVTSAAATLQGEARGRLAAINEEALASARKFLIKAKKDAEKATHSHGLKTRIYKALLKTIADLEALQALLDE